jgi:serine/threonine-protein kinase
MRPERWQEVKRLVQEALELPEDDREAYFSDLEDEELRRAAQDLLEVSATRADAFDHIRVLPLGSDIPFKEGDTIGRYTILRGISRGGMGAVYQARDSRNGRIVALKILPPRVLPFSPNEDKALARLTHPNIATFFESDITETGFRFVAMEYVEGTSITSFCREHCPTVRSRLELFRKVCSAVEYAHEHLVVHRDIKPDNILVTLSGEPKLLDFGIAKILPGDLTLATLTRSADRPLTLAFASPEQLGGEPTATTTDVYSLGVLLCLLLTGHLPYRIKSPHDLPFAIRNMEPERPSALVSVDSPDVAAGDLPEGDTKRLRRRLEGDLDAIVLRTLRKEPDRRYRFVAELSEDIRRYLDHEPVTARRGTRRYRTTKFIERYRLGTGVGILALLILLGFTAALYVLEQEAVAQRDAARREAKRSEAVSGFLVDMFKVSNPWTALGQTISAREVLDNAALKFKSASPPDPAVRGTLLHSLGKINLNLGLYAPAEALLEPALVDLRVTYGDKRLIAATLTDLATVRYYHARYGEAERYALQALSIDPAGRDLALTLDLWSLLGRIAFARGDYAGAERLFREALMLAGKLHGPASLRASSAMNDLACALHSQGKYPDAAAFYGSALAIRRRLLGNSHPAALQVLHNLACLDRDQGESQKAQAEFLAVRLAYRKISEPNYPSLPAFFHNMGSTLLSAGKLDEADRLLFESLSGHHKFFADDHPNVGRTLAEFGRLEDARGRYQEAETYYKKSLDRLALSLGPDHPDRITAGNNFAVLRAHEGRRGEAENLWRELLRRAAAHPLRRDIDPALRGNLATLLHQSRTDTATYRTVGIEMLDLTASPDFTALEIPQASLPRPINDVSGILLFFDDFAGSAIDPSRWEFGGTTVEQEQGELRLLAAVADHGGGARTVPIRIDPTKPLVISRRAKVHAANDYFDGTMSVGIPGYPEKSFGVSYANYHYTGAGECVTVGFSLFRHGANSHRFADRRADASPLIPPIWDRWFAEELRYDPRTGELRYFIDGLEQLTYNVGPLPPNASSIILNFSTWGWYTGHYQYVDWVRVVQ